jgi:hypothetical protein
MVETKKVRPVSTTSARIYHLRVSLEGIEPLIWRRLQVPGSASLGWLHAVIQVAMGGPIATCISSSSASGCIPTRLRADEFEDDPRVLDRTRPRSTKSHPGKSAFVLRIRLRRLWIIESQSRRFSTDADRGKVAKCLDGERACPPEDCGGVWGYEDLLKIIRNSKHEEYESMMEWLGSKFDPEAFDRNTINKHLRKLKWPHTTVDQLASVLMRRDGIRE